MCVRPAGCPCGVVDARSATARSSSPRDGTPGSRHASDPGAPGWPAAYAPRAVPPEPGNRPRRGGGSWPGGPRCAALASRDGRADPPAAFGGAADPLTSQNLTWQLVMLRSPFVLQGAQPPGQGAAPDPHGAAGQPDRGRAGAAAPPPVQGFEGDLQLCGHLVEGQQFVGAASHGDGAPSWLVSRDGWVSRGGAVSAVGACTLRQDRMVKLGWEGRRDRRPRGQAGAPAGPTVRPGARMCGPPGDPGGGRCRGGRVAATAPDLTSRAKADVDGPRCMTCRCVAVAWPAVAGRAAHSDFWRRMIMTTGPAGPGGRGNGPHPPHTPSQPGPPEAPAAGKGPDGDDVDVLYLAGQRPPAAGAWLLVTAVDGAPGGQFTAQVLPGAGPSAFGGDVVVQLDADDPAMGQPPPAARVQVHAVLGGRLIPVASWPGQDLHGWPERIRTAVAFAMGVLTELEEHDADLGASIRVDLSQAAGQATAGIPLHLTFSPGKATPLAP